MDVRAAAAEEAADWWLELKPAANQRGCGSYRAGGVPGSGRGCSAGRGRGPLVRWRGTPAAAANSSDGTTVEGDGGQSRLHLQLAHT